MFFQQIVNGIVVGSVYALTAMGATLVYGIMRFWIYPTPARMLSALISPSFSCFRPAIRSWPSSWGLP